MTGYLIIAVVSVWAVLLQVSLVHLLPTSENLLFLPLVFVVFLITEFRKKDALFAAVTAGLALDAISSMPAGVNTTLLVVGWLTADFLFHRVFTNQSALAIIGLHATTFIAWSAGLSVMRLVRASLFGWAWNEPGVWPEWWIVIIGAALQAVFAMVSVAFIRFVYRRLAHGFMLTGRRERGWR